RHGSRDNACQKLARNALSSVRKLSPHDPSPYGSVMRLHRYGYHTHAAHDFRHTVMDVDFRPDQDGLGPTERAPEQSFCFRTLAVLHLPRPPSWPDGERGRCSESQQPQDGQEREGPRGHDQDHQPHERCG
ncbi:hypothetical protein CORC01_10987, partial [Colletotrichum orchidophilum]